MTAQQLTDLLSNPLVLFLVMIAASLGSGFKQVYEAKRAAGVEMTMGDYLTHWPETLITLGGNIGLFFTLAATGQLNLASALGLGYAANSLAGGIVSMTTGNGRSASVNPPKEGGYARPALLGGLALGAAALLALVACATVNPLSAAKTTEQRAFALYGTFVVAEEAAVDVLALPGLSAADKANIKAADAAAKPAADALLDAAQQAFRIRAELEAGTSTDDKLRIATANLERWVNETGPKIEALLAAIRRK